MLPLTSLPLHLISHRQSSIDPEELKQVQKQMNDPMKALKDIKEAFKDG